MVSDRRQFLAASGAGIALGLFGGAGCGAHRASVTARSGATVSRGNVTVQITSLGVVEHDPRALEVGLTIRNEGEQVLEFRQKDVQLADSAGTSVSAVLNPPPRVRKPNDSFFQPNDGPGMRTLKVVTFPIALMAGLIILPFTLPMTVIEKAREGRSRWVPSYSETIIVATVEPNAESTVQVYFDITAIDAEKLSALRIGHPITEDTIEIRF